MRRRLLFFDEPALFGHLDQETDFWMLALGTGAQRQSRHGHENPARNPANVRHPLPSLSHAAVPAHFKDF
jgi:hypothetical protein